MVQEPHSAEKLISEYDKVLDDNFSESFMPVKLYLDNLQNIIRNNESIVSQWIEGEYLEIKDIRGFERFVFDFSGSITKLSQDELNVASAILENEKLFYKTQQENEDTDLDEFLFWGQFDAPITIYVGVDGETELQSIKIAEAVLSTEFNSRLVENVDDFDTEELWKLKKDGLPELEKEIIDIQIELTTTDQREKEAITEFLDLIRSYKSEYDLTYEWDNETCIIDWDNSLLSNVTEGIESERGYYREVTALFMGDLSTELRQLQSEISIVEINPSNEGSTRVWFNHSDSQVSVKLSVNKEYIDVADFDYISG